MKTVIVVPAYKPSDAFPAFVKELCENGFEVVAIDDGGGAEFDDIFGKVKEICHLIRYTPNRGKGSALKTGFAYIKENIPDAEYIVTADADGQHKIADIARVAKRLEEEKSGCMVLGSRHFENKVPFKSRFGNSVTKVVFGLLTGRRIADTQTGLRGFYASQIDWLISVKGDRYEYEMNMLMQAVEIKLPFKEVTIETVYENNNEGSHFRPVVDAIRIYKIMLGASSAVKFLLSALTAFTIDFVLYALFLKVFGAVEIEKRLLISTLLAWMVSSFSNFMINRVIVFKKKDAFLASLAGYYSLAVFVYFAKLGIIQLLVFLRVNEYVAKLIAEGTLFIMNYFIQKLLIFRKKKSSPEVKKQ